MNCRIGCGACCIAPSISSFIPGMPDGKPAGVRCFQLDPNNRCRLFGRPERPAVCVSLRPSLEMCGCSDNEALARLMELERMTGSALRLNQGAVNNYGGLDAGKGTGQKVEKETGSVHSRCPQQR